MSTFVSSSVCTKRKIIVFPISINVLTHWGRVAHIFVGKITIIGSDNGLSPGRRQAIIWANAGILLIGPLGTNFSQFFIGIRTFSFKKMYLKMSYGKCRPFCLGLNMLMFFYGISCIQLFDTYVDIPVLSAPWLQFIRIHTLIKTPAMSWRCCQCLGHVMIRFTKKTTKNGTLAINSTQYLYLFIAQIYSPNLMHFLLISDECEYGQVGMVSITQQS